MLNVRLDSPCSMRAALGMKPLKVGSSSKTVERETSEKKRHTVSISDQAMAALSLTLALAYCPESGHAPKLGSVNHYHSDRTAARHAHGSRICSVHTCPSC